MRRRSLALDLALGAAAGVGATWLMDKVTTALYERERRPVQNRENAARGDRTAYEIAAEKAAGLAGRDLSARERKQAGASIHWALGGTAGAIYGLIRNRTAAGTGSGILYGSAFWIVMDEGALTVFGLTPSPAEFPWQTHARGLAGHLVLGGALEAAFDVADVMI